VNLIVFRRLVLGITILVLAIILLLVLMEK
jgi:hypothetical protein